MYRIESKKGIVFIDNWVTAWNAFVGKEIDNLTVIIEKEKNGRRSSNKLRNPKDYKMVQQVQERV